MPPLVELRQAAKALSISIRTLHRVTSERRIASRTSRGERSIPRPALIKYLADRID